MPTHLYLTQAVYDQNVTAQNGICMNCQTWSWGGCPPTATGVTCAYCRKKKVDGATTALNSGFLIITG